MLVLSRAEVEDLLDLDRLIEALVAAMEDLSAGRASVPSRHAAVVADRDAFLASMVSYSPAGHALAAKLMSVFPHNADGPLPTHQGVICTFDAASGEPVALMDATYITAMRTAAGSALATRLLARPDAAVMAVLGTGVQARAHARLVPRVLRLREIRVAGRDPARRAPSPRSCRGSSRRASSRWAPTPRRSGARTSSAPRRTPSTRWSGANG